MQIPTHNAILQLHPSHCNDHKCNDVLWNLCSHSYGDYSWEPEGFERKWYWPRGIAFLASVPIHISVLTVPSISIPDDVRYVTKMRNIKVFVADIIKGVHEDSPTKDQYTCGLLLSRCGNTLINKIKNINRKDVRFNRCIYTSNRSNKVSLCLWTMNIWYENWG